MGVTQPHPAVLVGLMGLLAACVATDLRSRRIPNVVTAPAMLAGTAMNYTIHGTDGLLTALGGLALGLVILTPPFALGGIGAGDVKMMGAAGTFLGPTLLAISIVTGLLLGGIVAVVAASRQGRLGETLRRTVMMTVGAVLTGSTTPLREPTSLPGGILLPYSVPLAAGTILAVGWTMVGPS